MADRSKIEWTDATWNVITGCSVESAGCKHCYAMKLAGTRLQHHPSRAGLTVNTKAGPVWTGEVRFNEDWLDQPLRWKKSRMIFVCAHSDLFHEAVPDEWIDRVFAVMALAQSHTFQVLTKRAGRMRDYLQGLTMERLQAAVPVGYTLLYRGMWLHSLPLKNVWLGVSVEDQAAATERVRALCEAPAAVRWISAEPLLGPVTLGVASPCDRQCSEFQNAECPGTNGPCVMQANLDWVVVGAESGTNARPMHPAWARSLRDQCAAAGVPFLFKQWGAFIPADQAECDLNACYEHSSGGGWVNPNGSFALGETAAPGEYGAVHVFQLAAKHAGRMLDGVVHDAYPARAA